MARTRENFTFRELKISVDERLYYRKDKKHTCVVLDEERGIRYEHGDIKDERRTISNLTSYVDSTVRRLIRRRNLAPLPNWLYKNEILQERRERLEKISSKWENENKKLLIFEEKPKNLDTLNRDTSNENNIDESMLGEYESSTIIKTRIGQGAFREELYEKWGGCSVTGYRQLNMLIASHIKPWRKSVGKEKTDENNGLLLVANLDKAFDQGLITFKDDGNILISDALKDPEAIGITQDMKLRKAFKGNNKYLTHHREHVFNKE